MVIYTFWKKSLIAGLVVASLCLSDSIFFPAAQLYGQQDWISTRSGDQTRYGDQDKGPRTLATAVIKELDLREGDVVADIGAGNGWWSEKVAEHIGPKGVVYAAEIKTNLVDKMTKKYSANSSIQPTLVDTDNLKLADDTLDLAFFVKVYHHVDKREDYWRHLQQVVKPDGRVIVVDRHPVVPDTEKVHSMSPAVLFEEAQAGGWFPVRYEQLPRSGYYVAVFVQRQVFK